MKTKPFNPFDYFESEEEARAYLIDCFNDDDPQVFVNALGYLARRQGVARVAEKSGLNRESLYKVINGTAQPRWSTVHRLVRALDVDVSSAA